MTEKRFKPVGGVAHAELFAVHSLGGVEDIVSGQGVAVPLMDDGSHYDEQIEASGLPVSVEHTLTLCSDRNLAQQWFDGEFLRQVAADGVVALVELATGEQLTVGWCRRMAFEQALRLNSLEFDSGQGLNDSPRVKMVLCCRDVTSAFNIE